LTVNHRFCQRRHPRPAAIAALFRVRRDLTGNLLPLPAIFRDMMTPICAQTNRRHREIEGNRISSSISSCMGADDKETFAGSGVVRFRDDLREVLRSLPLRSRLSSLQIVYYFRNDQGPDPDEHYDNDAGASHTHSDNRDDHAHHNESRRHPPPP
jgi:hypothetical protein